MCTRVALRAMSRGLMAWGAKPPRMLPPRSSPSPPSEQDHVRTDPLVRRHRQALAFELRILMHSRYGDARPICYREIDRLVAAHDGDVPPPEDALSRLRLDAAGELLCKQRSGVGVAL